MMKEWLAMFSLSILIYKMEFTDSLGFTIRRRLHPAMYQFALACRTFDLQYAKTSNKTFTDVVEAHMFRILHWCKKLAK
ncbi:hypothetical protein QL285_057278 [Trifolium repens]|nr:hypothetical protein QL285_057278 [Trifolium repens]